MPIEYQLLLCPTCDGRLFSQLVVLKHKPGSGLIEDRAGWVCMQCHEQVDTQAMLHQQTLREKREELRQLERELGVEHAPEPAR